jgi:hypothetical protein
MITFRVEADAVLMYIEGHGPMEFTLGGKTDESAEIIALLAAVRDGRLRAVGWCDREGAFHAQRFEIWDVDGKLVGRVYPPTEIPRLRRGKPDVIRTFEPMF